GWPASLSVMNLASQERSAARPEQRLTLRREYAKYKKISKVSGAGAIEANLYQAGSVQVRFVRARPCRSIYFSNLQGSTASRLMPSIRARLMCSHGAGGYRRSHRKRAAVVASAKGRV